MKGMLKKLMRIGFAGALSLLAFAPSAVMAQEKSVQIEIPVTTDFSDDSDIPANTVKLTSTFKLEPVDSAPAPAINEISIDRDGKAKFGAITITRPENYYYKLTGTLDNGTNSEASSVTRIVRIGVENDNADGLRYVAQAYLSMEDAVADKAAAPVNPEDKPDTKFLITYKEPKSPTPTPTPRDPKKAAKTKTSVYAQPGLWILIGGAALLILIGAGKRSNAR
ncbi:hypothetical protein [Faecalibaculum rodentium]|uniref:hypothetical protein n=1 Tax=Faecalibaculum rodentium TaxID=1702221 RepID=UPI00266F0B4B|nr:hypothetical protein [Faecalibaculum rodentium]